MKTPREIHEVKCHSLVCSRASDERLEAFALGADALAAVAQAEIDLRAALAENLRARASDACPQDEVQEWAARRGSHADAYVHHMSARVAEIEQTEEGFR